MNFSKISTLTSGMFPAEWNGKYEDNVITEQITYGDGSKMTLIFEIEDSIESIMAQSSEDYYHEDSIENDEDIDDEVYVMVEENGKSFPIHKDVLDVYMELMEVE